MTLNVKLARDGEALERLGTTILRAPTGSSRKCHLTAVFVGGGFPTVAPVAAAEEEDDDEEDDDEEDEDEEDEDEEDDEEDAPVKG
jgi:hypothetical protein